MDFDGIENLDDDQLMEMYTNILESGEHVSWEAYCEDQYGRRVWSSSSCK